MLPATPWPTSALPGLFPLRRSRAACLRVAFDALPFFGTANFTPARRALDRPNAIACLAERARVYLREYARFLPRTNFSRLGAGDLPSALSSAARSKVSFSGIMAPFDIFLVRER